jgi:transposase
MWTQENRARHKGDRTKAKRGYPSDVSDAEWRLIEPLLLGCAKTGRPRTTDLRTVINALRYVVRSGCE